MSVWEAEIGREYTVQAIAAEDEELETFLFSLGLYSGEPITVVSRLKKTVTVSIGDGRYSIDRALSEAILL